MEMSFSMNSIVCSADAVRNDYLTTMRGLKYNRINHAVQCVQVIAAGTSSIAHLNPIQASPFNVADSVQSPYFAIDETRKLFRESCRI